MSMSASERGRNKFPHFLAPATEMVGLGHFSAYVMLLLCLGHSSALLELRELVEWKLNRSLYEYTTYGSVTIERIDVPLHSVVVNFNSSVESSSDRCPLQYVTVFASQFGFPVVSRDKEAFPRKVFVSQTPVLNVTMASNNQTVSWQMDYLKAGQLFLMAVMPQSDSRIKQQGLEIECNYFMNTQVSIIYYLQQDIPQLGSDTSSIILSAGLHSLLSFQLPADVKSYTVDIQGCSARQCPVNVSVWETLSISMEKDSNDCHWTNGSCRLQVTAPAVDALSYLSLTTDTNMSLSILVVITSCNVNTTVGYLQHHTRKDTSFTCVLAGVLGRETPRQEESTSNFNDHFVTWDQNFAPHSVVNLKIPDTVVLVTMFTLRTSDTGSSLNVHLHLPLEKSSSLVHIFLCLSTHRIHHPMLCQGGATLNVTGHTDKNKDYVIVPYPQSGLWFISMESRCFHVDPNTSTEVPGLCKSAPVVNLTVHLAQCLDGGCGRYGTCKMYMESDLLYSACNCYSGWRGYGCNDGSKAGSAAEEILAVYLLTLSNLGFIPAICLAMYRRFYIEALVYSYNMFFSTFYHACDTSNIYQLCILPYNSLSFADFFASLLSFWVTLMAMARIPQGVRSFQHMLGALFISLGEVYNRHGLMEQMMPIVGGVFIVLVSWAVESYRRKSLFPSKRRLLKLILPGVTLSCLGLAINLAFQTESNYKYAHSLWHLLESLCILLLLPPRKYKSGTSNNLSIQSGDITRQSSLDSQEFQANIQPANDSTEITEPEASSSPPQTPRASLDQHFKLLSRDRPSRRLSQNLVL